MDLACGPCGLHAALHPATPPSHPPTTSLNPTLPAPQSLLCTQTLRLHALFIFHNMNITSKSLSVSHSSDSGINVNPDKQKGFSSG